MNNLKLQGQPDQGRKVSSQQQFEEVATGILEQEMEKVQGTSSAQAASRHTHIPYSTERILLYILQLDIIRYRYSTMHAHQI